MGDYSLKVGKAILLEMGIVLFYLSALKIHGRGGRTNLQIEGKERQIKHFMISQR